MARRLIVSLDASVSRFRHREVASGSGSWSTWAPTLGAFLGWSNVCP